MKKAEAKDPKPSVASRFNTVFLEAFDAVQPCPTIQCNNCDPGNFLNFPYTANSCNCEIRKWIDSAFEFWAGKLALIEAYHESPALYELPFLEYLTTVARGETND